MWYRMKNNKGFTFIEIMISLLLLAIFILLMTSSLKLTSKVSKKFLDFTNYEYAMMHKKIFELYDESQKIYVKGNDLIFENKDKDILHRVVITNKKIYKTTKNPGENSPRGYSLLLENLKSVSVSVNEDINENNSIVIINIIDRENKLRTLHLKLKDEEENN